MYSLPPDPDAAIEALVGYPGAADDVIGMHLGRYHPTPYEFTPGVAPLVTLLEARAGLLTNPDHLQKKAEGNGHTRTVEQYMADGATNAIAFSTTVSTSTTPTRTGSPKRRATSSGR